MAEQAAKKISLAKSAGFCLGVRRAIQLAYQTAGLGKTVSMPEDIIHNEEVIKVDTRSRYLKN